MGRFTGERRALAAAVLAFYGFLFMLVSLSPPPGWGATFGALALVYGAGFFALVAGYFWARWYAIGLGASGLISAVVSMWQVGPEPVLMFYGGTHAFVSASLWGIAMSKVFDGRTEWRERFHMDENATHKLGKSVIRLGVSLPYVVMYALAPREDAGAAALALGGLALALGGAWAITRMRSWGVLAVAGAVGALVASMIAAPPMITLLSGTTLVNVPLLGVGAVAFLVFALAPLARDVARALDRA